MTIHAQNTFQETLSVVTDKSYQPYSFIDSHGNYAGLDVELINEIANRLHMNLNLRLLDWPRANAAFKSGKADIIMNIETDLLIQDKNVVFTLPTAEKQYVVYGRESVKAVADLYGHRVASLHHLPGLGLEKNITYLDSYETIFKRLQDGSIDFAICPIQVGDYFLRKLEIHNIHASYAVGHIFGALALSSKNTVLCDKLNALLKELWQEGFMDHLNSKWVRHYYVNTTIKELVERSPWLTLCLILFILIFLFLLIYLRFEHKQAVARENYTEHLKKNLHIIEEQRRHLENNQTALEEARKAAEASSQAKSIFLSNMSHDIRTPMNAIIGYANLGLRQETTIQVAKSYLTKIGAASRHLLSLINDVLEMSRIESGKVEPEKGPVSFAELLSDLYTILVSQASSRKQTLHVDAFHVRHEHIKSDRLRLNQILLNLASNAVKYTQEGGRITITLTELSASETQGRYVFVVEDNGMGMSEEFAQKIFEAFERERNSTVSGIQGTGLGMAITKRLVDMLGGDIQVQTAKGKGTAITVRFTFPLDQQSTSPLPDMTGTNVLVVESDEKTAESLTEILKTFHISVRHASTTADMEKLLSSETSAEDALQTIFCSVALWPDVESLLKRKEEASDTHASVILLGFELDRPEDSDLPFCARPLFASNVAKPLQETHGLQTSGEKTDSAQIQADFNGTHVLLVDDVDLNREIAKAMLEMNGFVVDLAVNGREAVDLFRAAQPDTYQLILMDVQMPVLDGYEATKEIRLFEDPRKAHIPILAMTANAFEDDKRAALAAGMNGHIAKPIDLPVLLKTLEQVLLAKK